jgi:hypothetical protein
MNQRRVWAAVVCVWVMGCSEASRPGSDGGVGGGGGSTDMATGGGGGGGDDADVCQSTDVQAMSAKLPVDIIWVIDNSGSMKEEEGYIKTNLNSFSSNIAASGVDYHVVVIADTSHITVPPPLGGSPQFLAINQNIDSHNALSMIISTYPQWQSFLRPNSKRHFVL